MTSRAAAAAFAAALLALAGCGFVSFRKPPTDDELRLSHEVRALYTEAQRAFAAGNAQALASLYDGSITRPMTRGEIEAWADDFFSKHGRASLRLLEYSLDDVGFERAVVALRYRVEPADGRGGFEGRELDTLVKRGGRWYIASWDKLK